MKNTDLYFTDDAIIIKESYMVLCLPYHDILFFQLNSSYITIGLIREKSVFIRSSLSLILKAVPKAFYLCNRNTILNMLYVKSIVDDKVVTISNNECFTLSRRKRNLFVDYLLQIKKNPISCCKCFCCNLSSVCKSNFKNAV